MFLDHSSVQQVRTHGAAIDRCAYQLVDGFCDRFFGACPHLRRSFATDTRQRREMAHRWAWFIRHLGETDLVKTELGGFGKMLTSRGFSHQTFLTARACLLEATRGAAHTCNAPWGPAQESAWASAIDACLEVMNPSARMFYAKAA